MISNRAVTGGILFLNSYWEFRPGNSRLCQLPVHKLGTESTHRFLPVLKYFSGLLPVTPLLNALALQVVLHHLL
uniref:Uncharacterized protein n=1 Tax=Anguilla anguilla TaxID=7936 RepID=A0A0E9WQV8_ANGAN